jgi:hypothetical protein
MRFVFSDIRAELDAAIKEIQRPIAIAATGAVAEAADVAKTKGRASISGQGFGARWQSALRADVFPKGSRHSMRPAALIYHKIPYAGVFEEPTQISGKPMLWLPLPTVPMGSGGRRLTPSQYRAKVGHPLYSLKRAGGPPLLGANVRTSGSRSVSLSLLKRGRNPGGRGTVKLIPLYVGVPAVKLRKRFGIGAIVRAAADQLGALYIKHLKV